MTSGLISLIIGIAVVARSSSFMYKGRVADAKLVGRELGAGYVLEGSVRKVGRRVRVAGIKACGF